MSYRIERAARRDLRVRAVGHPFAPIGMGEHVRSVWRSLDEVGVDAGIVDVYGPQGAPDAELLAQYGDAITPQLGDGVNIYCINGDEIKEALGLLANPMAEGSRNVIYPLWELERYPMEWAKQLMRFDEVWAPSAFIRDAIAKAVDIPVIHMPLACEVKRRALRSRRHFGIRESAYAFFFSFDFLSRIERKNPFAAIEAFRALTAERPFDDVTLVIKTNNADQRPKMKARFDAAVAPLRERVKAIHGTLSDLEMKSLIWLADCFVSLHRSEGFGLGLSEAMALGKPVIATAYSGNMDFCTEETACLIPYDLIPVRAREYPHWQNQRWADPDVEAATRAMRDLVDNPGKGRDMGARARVHLATHFSYLATGLRYQKRLEELTRPQGEEHPRSARRSRRGRGERVGAIKDGESASIEKLFPELATFGPEDFARIGIARPTLMIAMTARTGSTHLCSGLSSVLPIGLPIELLNGRDALVWEKQRRGVQTFAELLAQYFSESPETIIFKTSWGDFAYFEDRIFDIFPNLKILYFDRLDIEAQAVSLFKADVTGNWHESPLIEKPSNMPPEEIAKKFDPVGISRMIDALNSEMTAWENFFFRHEIQPMRINYESFMFDLRPVVRQVARYIGYADVDVSNVKSDFKALSDPVNEEWLKDIRDYRNGDLFARRQKELSQLNDGARQ